MSEQQQINELSRIVNLEKVSQGSASYTITATQEECKALAKRFGIVDVKSVKATFKVLAAEASRGGYYVDARLFAEVVQSCVATLEDVSEQVEVDFHLHVVDQRYEIQDPFDPEQEEDFEYSVEGEIDLGELASQYLALSLNPYPRSDMSEEDSAQENIEKKVSPFDVLKKLKS